jgi:hypothetical protein
VALVLTVALAAGFFPLEAQTTAAGTETDDQEIKYPQWSRDLRRAEIIAFGTIPFSWLIATVAVDLSRTMAHGGSQQYWPWPLKPADAPPMADGEFILTIGIAAGISVTAALVDHIIIKHKRKKDEQNKRIREPGIIQTPAANFNGDPPPIEDASGSVGASSQPVR